ncbi:MAG: hypothetical protein HY363_04320 [Candidatus Aenigmarchaeota archaeon]|nr:hypothetical protein [Candidatus Aenigmarchaeota archaeon]
MKAEILPLIYVFGIIIGFAMLSSLFLPTSITSVITLAFAIWFYFVLPGYCLLLFLDMKPHERIIIGTAVSAAVVPVVLYTLDIFGIPLSRLTVLITILVICGGACMLKSRL